jgi:hypothetical protein
MITALFGAGAAAPEAKEVALDNLYAGEAVDRLFREVGYGPGELRIQTQVQAGEVIGVLGMQTEGAAFPVVLAAITGAPRAFLEAMEATRRVLARAAPRAAGRVA